MILIVMRDKLVDAAHDGLPGKAAAER